VNNGEKRASHRGYTLGLGEVLTFLTFLRLTPFMSRKDTFLTVLRTVPNPHTGQG